MKTMNQSYRKHPGLCAAAILACLSATAGATSLVANWRLDESSGNAISDANATYNGTLTGSPTQNAPGKIGTAYTLNGINYVAPGGPPSPVSSTLTISAWVYPTTSNWGNIVHWKVGGQDIQFGMNNGVGMRYRQDGGITGTLPLPVAILSRLIRGRTWCS